MQQEAAIREPLILGNKSYKDITNDVVGPIQGEAPLGWKIMITITGIIACLLYTSPSPRDRQKSRMPSSA